MDRSRLIWNFSEMAKKIIVEAVNDDMGKNENVTTRI